MACAQVIDWESSETHFFLNPRLHERTRHRLEETRHELPDLPGHIWLLTSGTSSVDCFKWIALSKRAFLCSAAAVNQNLEISKADHWLLALPTFHVGGLSIFARAHLSGSNITEYVGSWSAVSFIDQLKKSKATLCSLVPTQLYDLVSAGLVAPPSLRTLIIGGSGISAEIFARAAELGYPVLTTYGMTETCSQIASSKINEMELRPLRHVSLKVDEQDHICVKSDSLLTGQATVTEYGIEFIDPKVDGWFRTEDLGFIEAGVLHVFGRASEQVKISGELVLLPRQQAILANFNSSAVIIDVPEERLGSALVAVVPLSELNQGTLGQIASYNTTVAPFERVIGTYFVKQIPVTETGKVQLAALRKQIGFA